MYPYKERQIKWDDYGELIKYIKDKTKNKILIEKILSD